LSILAMTPLSSSRVCKYSDAKRKVCQSIAPEESFKPLYGATECRRCRLWIALCEGCIVNIVNKSWRNRYRVSARWHGTGKVRAACIKWRNRFADLHSEAALFACILISSITTNPSSLSSPPPSRSAPARDLLPYLALVRLADYAA
jgi:hypothetical protein